MGFGDLIFGGIYKGYLASDKLVEKMTGKGLIDRGIERNAADEIERKEEPLKWVGKRLAKGTIKGLLGAGVHGDL